MWITRTKAVRRDERGLNVGALTQINTLALGQRESEIKECIFLTIAVY